MTEKILHQAIEVVVIPHLNERHAAFIRLQLYWSSPIAAIEAFDVRVDFDFQRIFQSAEVGGGMPFPGPPVDRTVCIRPADLTF